MVKQKQTHTCRATLAIVLSTNSAGYGSSSGAVRSLTHARVRACKSSVSGGIRGPPETEARMSAMSSMMCRQHLAATNLTGRQFSPLLCMKDAPRDWKPNSVFCPFEIHFDNTSSFINCQPLCAHVMVISKSSRITDRRQRVATEVAACRSDDTEPSPISQLSLPMCIREALFGLHYVARSCVTSRFARLFDRQLVARVVSSSRETPTGRSLPPPPGRT